MTSSPNLFADPGLRANPYPLYSWLRNNNPVLFVESRGWLISKYADVEAILRDYRRFSSAMEIVKRDDISREDRAPTMLTTDPPMHTRLRGVVAKAFTPKRVAGMEPRIREIAVELLDSIASDSFDLVGELAGPLPVIVIAEMLGVPASDRDKFKRWSTDIVAVIGNPVDVDFTLADAAGEEFRAYFGDIIAARRAEPRDDLVTALVNARDDNGNPLTEEELLSFCVLLLIAGNVTTTSLISNAARALTENPAQLERLLAEPTLLASALEETVRYYPPFLVTGRVTTEAVEVGGETIPVGADVALLMGAANRDEAVFEKSETFDIARQPNKHLGYGAGIHFCLGAPLARLEGRVAVEELLRRWPSLRRANEDTLEFVPALFMNSLAAFHVSAG